MPQKPSRNHSQIVNGYACRDDIIGAVNERIDAAVDQCGRVLPVRFDFRFPQEFGPQDMNGQFGRMLDGLNQDLRRKGIGNEYVWSREVGAKNEREHYHLLMLLDGRKLQSSHTVHEKAKGLWERALQRRAPGCVHKASPASRRDEPRENWLDRNKDDFAAALAEVKAWGAYLAKEAQKGKAPKNIREFSGSQLKMNASVKNKKNKEAGQ